jgi:hypothetical protein
MSSSTAEFARTRPSRSRQTTSSAWILDAYASASTHDRLAAVAKVRNHSVAAAERAGLSGAPMCRYEVRPAM